MKKTISLLLALVLCLSLCACGDGNDLPETKGNEEITSTNESNNQSIEQSIDILGEWVWVGDDSESLTFNEDNTCLYSNGNSVKYSVDTTLAIITLYDNTTKNFDIIEENGIIKISGSKVYVRKENYETAHFEYEEAKQAELAAEMQKLSDDFTSGKAPLEIGKAYKCTEETEITFTGFSVAEKNNQPEYLNVSCTVQIKNTSSETIKVNYEYPTCAGKGVLYAGMITHNFTSYIDVMTVDGGYGFSLNTGESIEKEFCIFTVQKEGLLNSQKKYGEILGFSELTFDGTPYYFSLADIFSNYELG